MRSSVRVGLVLVLSLGASCGGPELDRAAERRVEAHLAALCADDGTVRATAARALAGAYPAAARAVPVLAEALADDDATVRAAAAATLEALARQGVEPVLAFLHDEEDAQRAAFVQVVQEIVRLGAKVTPPDIAELMHGTPRSGLVLMLGTGMHHARLPPYEANRWLFAFLDRCADPSSHATLGHDDPRWPALAAAVAAYGGMGALGPQPEESLPPAIAALCDDPSPALARFASVARMAWGASACARDRDDDEVVPGPTARATDLDAVLAGLARLDAPQSEAAASSERRELMRAAWTLVPDASAADRRRLAEALKATWERNLGVRHRVESIRLLLRMDADLAFAVPWILVQLDAWDGAWQRFLHEGREGVPPGDVVALVVVEGAGYAGVLENRLLFADLLGRIGPAARAGVPVLERRLAASDPTMRYLAARSLRRIRAD